MDASKVNLAAFNNLSPKEKAYALKVLQELSETGQSDTLNDLKYSDFEEVPVDIDTFLDDDDYFGSSIWMADEYSGERRCTLFPYWRETLRKLFPDNLTTAYNTLILTGAIGLGKAQPMDALVLTEDGFKKMGELTLSDKVYGSDGKLHRIIGIFPQGRKKICRVSFTDGTSTLCCDEHLWTVHNVKNNIWTTVETKQLIDGSRNLKHSVGHRYKIPMTKPIEFTHKDVKIDPYILGVLIGDGHITKSTLFASNDVEIVNEVSKALLPNYEVRKLKCDKYTYNICMKNRIGNEQNAYNKNIADYNLNVTAADKHIPSDYLLNDIDSRISLLQGLMDTDGYISKDGALIEFTTISEKLKDDFVWLVQSLGGVCHVRTKKTSYINKKLNKKVECSLSYNIGIKLPKSICPFRLPRKKDRLNDKSLEPYRYITNIEYIGEDECQCIYINSDEHLYLTNDFIVTHNTEVAVLAMSYLLYRMLCLKDPYAYYGMMPNDKITFSMLNITLDAAQGVGWEKMQQHIQASPWFMTHGSLNASRSNPTWQPPKGIELIFGSNNRHVVGRALFSNITDEVNFGIGSDVEKKKEKQKKMIAQIDARMKSRFMKGTYLPTLNIIISSKDTEQSFLDSYINTKKQNESKTTLIIDEPQWVVRNDKGSPNDPGSFYVAVGNKVLAHELLPVNFPDSEADKYREKGYTLIKVPPGFREDFETNLDQSLMDIAGISSSSMTKYISGVRLNQAKVDTYKNPFTKDVIEVGNNPEDKLQYSNFFDLSQISPNDMTKPMFIHLDLSTTGDKTGIAGVWITGKRPTQGEEDASKELQFKLAFSVSIKAPKGYQISFEKTKTFIYWLRDRGFAIKGVSSDTFDKSIVQELGGHGFKTQFLSVDRVDQKTRVCLPYAYLKSAIYERHIEIYRKCDLLTDELIGLERMSSGKIDHTADGINSKDQADAVCGALYLASQFAEQFAYDYGESLNAALEVNAVSSEAYKRRQMITDFEQELTRAYANMNDGDGDNGFGKAEGLTAQDYQDILDGIVVI